MESNWPKSWEASKGAREDMSLFSFGNVANLQIVGMRTIREGTFRWKNLKRIDPRCLGTKLRKLSGQVRSGQQDQWCCQIEAHNENSTKSPGGQLWHVSRVSGNG